MHTRKRGGRKLFKQNLLLGRQEEEDPALIDPSVGVPIADNLDEAFYDDEDDEDDENADSINSGFSNIDYSVGEGNFNPFESSIEEEDDNIMIQPFADDESSIEDDDEDGVIFGGGKRKNKSMKKRNKKLTRKHKRQRKNKKPRKTVGRRKH